MKTKKSSSFTPKILLSIFVVLLVVSAYFGYRYSRLTSSRPRASIAQGRLVPMKSPDLVENIYTDSQTGISFRYPQNLSYVIQENGVVGFFDDQQSFEKCQQEHFSQQVALDSACLSVKYYLSGTAKYAQDEYEKYRTKYGDLIDPKTVIDAQQRKWQTDQVLGEAYNFEASTQYNGHIYQISLQSREDLRDRFTDILSGVEFADYLMNQPSTGWKTYINRTLGISFAYPPTLEISDSNPNNWEIITLTDSSNQNLSMQISRLKSTVGYGGPGTVSSTEIKHNNAPITINGKSIQRVTTTTDGKPTYSSYIKYSDPDAAYQLHVTYPFEKTPQPEEFVIFDQVLSTLNVTQ